MGGPVKLGYLIALFLISSVGPARAADYVLVRNRANSVQAVSKSELKDLLIGKTKVWKDDGVVQVVLPPPGSPEMKSLAETLLGVPENILLTKIKQEVFKGELRKPIVAATDSELVLEVAKMPGAFGLVKKETELPANVAVLSI